MTYEHKPDFAPDDFWFGVDAHIALMQKHQFKQTASLLKLYEADRRRSARAIQNLEDQMAALVKKLGEWGQVMAILQKSGIDTETLLKTDEVFKL